MPLPIGDTIGILADNLRLRKSVLPISAKGASRWAKGLGLPRGGETVLYTGLMYQLIPYITAMSASQEKVEDSFLAGMVGLGRQVNRLVSISAFMARPPAAVKEQYDKVLRDIAGLLRTAGVEFGYLYGDELYSGALIYDLGGDDLFADHARLVYDTFRKHGVKNVITVDPHTTNMLRSVYPSLIKGYDLKVRSYLEVLAQADLRPVRELGTEVVLHDSCVYARYENVLDPQRTLLARAGCAVREPGESGVFTHCCGGPAESLFPRKARQVAGERVEQLQEAGGRGVTMCPICLVNLRKASGPDLDLQDISGYLSRAYGA
ncbi:MAG: (Fe-S)-binding protein [Peptococcaceae bacterium]|jgi:Fe-S oxidoreductase|nr:(Fe-S)-binding protein [Peptococcaceae bacterium]